MKKVFAVAVIVLMLTGTAWATPPWEGGDTNVNTNLNANSNYNSNKNTNIQGQEQGQGQLQGQLQAQGINAPMTQGNVQGVTVVNDDKRELPVFPTGQAPNLFSYRGKHEIGVFASLKPWEVVKVWDRGYVDTFPYCNYFCTGDKAIAGIPNPIVCDNPFKVVAKSKLPHVMLVVLERKDPLELWGTVARIALENGINEVVVNDYKVTYANKASGWNVGLGGGVSVIDNGQNDHIGGSVGGGTGFGSVTTSPIEKAKGVFLLYWEPTKLKKD
jgi:hypothetical protein